MAAALVHRAIGDQLTCVFVDTGLLRLHEREQVERTLRANMGIKLVTVDASERFLDALAGVEDPEQKRTIIGHTFIDVFEEATSGAGKDAEFLVQGTLYPDVIEIVLAARRSVGDDQDASQRRRTQAGHEVQAHRAAARAVQGRSAQRRPRARACPRRWSAGIRSPDRDSAFACSARSTEPALDVLRQADAIYLEEIREANLYDEIWQAFAVLLPVRSVGVMGDYRTYENVVALRAVTSTDGMTADWYPFPHDVLGAYLESHHQRGARRESRRLRRELQAAGDDRVGVTRSGRSSSVDAPTRRNDFCKRERARRALSQLRRAACRAVLFGVRAARRFRPYPTRARACRRRVLANCRAGTASCARPFARSFASREC